LKETCFTLVQGDIDISLLANSVKGEFCVISTPTFIEWTNCFGHNGIKVRVRAVEVCLVLNLSASIILDFLPAPHVAGSEPSGPGMQ
jgi:hypothetical protein